MHKSKLRTILNYYDSSLPSKKNIPILLMTYISQQMTSISTQTRNKKHEGKMFIPNRKGDNIHPQTGPPQTTILPWWHQWHLILDRSVDLREICKSLISTYPDKSPGMDGITHRMLQAGVVHLQTALFLLMETIWLIKPYPEDWTKSLIQPIIKSGGKPIPDPELYRGTTKNIWRCH